MKRRVKWKAGSQEEGLKLIPFIKKKLTSPLPLRAIRWAIENNLCSVNGTKERYCSTVLKRGDEVSFIIDEPKAFRFEPKHTLFEDEHLLIYNKPAHIATEKLNPDLFLVHRLDKQTSGVLLLAKTKKAQKALEQLFRKREVTKSYIAIVKGRVTKPEGVIESFVGEIKRREGQTHWGIVSEERGHFAKTEFETLRANKHLSSLRLWPKTGRTHQLRVHLSHMGHPILGDVQYGSRDDTGPTRTLLHAEKISFIHPFTNEEISVFSPLPSDIKRSIKC